MGYGQLREYWALAAASVIGTAVLLFVLARLYQRTARGLLSLRLRELRRAQRRAAKAGRAAARASRRLARLRARADAVKPRLIDEAVGALADAEALRKIDDDRVQVAQNHLRKVIVEEYPPARHAALRARYLPDLRDDHKPFSF